MTKLLEVDGLRVAFQTEDGIATVIDDVSLGLEPGEVLGIVGESGCGKSVTALSIMGLLPRPSGRVTGGHISLDGTSLLQASDEEMRDIRGKRIAMIFQEPMTALNPVHRVGRQLAECYRLHDETTSDDAVLRRSVELLERVGIPAPEQRLNEYPHQLSGGMRQRVMIAMALAEGPEILIADEPTTALDVTIQAQILELLSDLQRNTGMAIIFITHDLGVIAEICSRVVVMYAGRIAEEAPVEQLFAAPLHPYTQGLLASIPRLDDEPKTILDTIPGMVPTIAELPPGCRFSNRCNYATPECSAAVPPLADAGNGRRVACIHWQKLMHKS